MIVTVQTSATDPTGQTYRGRDEPADVELPQHIVQPNPALPPTVSGRDGAADFACPRVPSSSLIDLLHEHHVLTGDQIARLSELPMPVLQDFLWTGLLRRHHKSC